jgi:hypothetical protein
VSVCPLCAARKGKRVCPARGAAICAACCGAKRLVEIDCPPDCVYLTGEHAGGWEGRERERARDLARLLPHMQALSAAQSQLLLVALVALDGVRQVQHAASDAHALAAIEALRRTLETRRSGILYEHRVEDPIAARLASELRGAFEPQRADGSRVAPDDADLSAVLGCLEAALRATAAEAAGPTAFLGSVARIAARLRREAASESPRIVVP